MLSLITVYRVSFSSISSDANGNNIVCFFLQTLSQYPEDVYICCKYASTTKALLMNFFCLTIASGENNVLVLLH